MVYEAEGHKGCTVKIVYDEDPQNPRTEWDNMGLLVMKGGYGDRLSFTPDPLSLNEVVEQTKRHLGGPILFMKVRRYEHGGIGLKAYMPDETPTGYPWDCPWDSGWAGIIAIGKEKVREEYGRKRITPGILEKVYANLRSEVETYSCYLNGETYGWIAEDPQGKQIDSCWGFYGNDLEYAKDQAREAIDGFLRDNTTPDLFEAATA